MNKSLAADWLSLGAAPTFALMAALCSAGSHACALEGMVPMYVLMSLFHTAPWWRRVLITDGPTAHGDGRTS
jgi:hypothetical protein